ncbi:hypothetical protein CPB83DRAFT_855863 [Crepidotus variabilis]|uniref:Uncharacterized protein n=1 Tax=Crepidotus variabilis TaxID=179855 RepID=A0A9P6JPD1_9AGAR|nr:hypothetical protein CPB83DRAFT_855863 [Crepidotus variabilis]
MATSHSCEWTVNSVVKAQTASQSYPLYHECRLTDHTRYNWNPVGALVVKGIIAFHVDTSGLEARTYSSCPISHLQFSNSWSNPSIPAHRLKIFFWRQMMWLTAFILLMVSEFAQLYEEKYGAKFTKPTPMVVRQEAKIFLLINRAWS